jgi:hypothetical protein
MLSPLFSSVAEQIPQNSRFSQSPWRYAPQKTPIPSVEHHFGASYYSNKVARERPAGWLTVFRLACSQKTSSYVT